MRLTNVPFRLFRSSIVRAPFSNVMTACCRERPDPVRRLLVVQVDVHRLVVGPAQVVLARVERILDVHPLPADDDQLRIRPGPRVAGTGAGAGRRCAGGRRRRAVSGRRRSVERPSSRPTGSSSIGACPMAAGSNSSGARRRPTGSRAIGSSGIGSSAGGFGSVGRLKIGHGIGLCGWGGGRHVEVGLALLAE